MDTTTIPVAPSGPAYIPVQVPKTPPSTTADGIHGSLNSTLDQLSSANDTAVENAQTAATTSKGFLQNIYDKITGVQNSQSIEEANAGIPQKTQNLTDAQNALKASQAGRQQELLALQGQGLTDVQKAQQSAEINRKYAAGDITLGITLNAAQGNLTTAKSLVDSKIKLELEPLQNQLNEAKQFYADNQKTLNDAQTSAAQNKIKVLDTQLAQATAGQKEVADYTKSLLDTGKATPKLLQQLSTAKNGQEAAAVLTSNGVNLVKGTGTGSGIGAGSSDMYQTFTNIGEADKNKAQSAFGGLSKTGVLNAAQLYLSNNGKMPSLGLGSSPTTQAKRDAIVNIGGAIADSLNLTLPQISAMYKANASSAQQIVSRVAKIDAVSNSLSNQFPRLSELATKVGNLGITESDITAGKAKAASKFGSVDAGNYVELIQTVRSEYAAMQSAVAGSQGSQYFAQSADKAIPIGLTPEQYQGLQQTILLSAGNATKGTQEEANKLIGNIGGNSLGSGGTLTSPDGTQQVDSSKLTPAQLKEATSLGWK